MRNHQRVSCRLICLEAMKIAEECGKAGELDATSQYVHKFGLAEEVLASQQFQSSCYDDRLPKKTFELWSDSGRSGSTQGKDPAECDPAARHYRRGKSRG